MDFGYARVSTCQQDLDCQLDALTSYGVVPEQIYLDSTVEDAIRRPGLLQVLEATQAGDVIVVRTLDRLGLTVRDAVVLVDTLSRRGVGVRNLAGPLRVDTADPDDLVSRFALTTLSMLVQMERIYARENATYSSRDAHPERRTVGRPRQVETFQIEYARRLRDNGFGVQEIVSRTGLSRTSLYRYVPSRDRE